MSTRQPCLLMKGEDSISLFKKNKLRFHAVLQASDRSVDSDNGAEWSLCVCSGEEPNKQMGIPPWQQKIFSSTMAATGKQLKQSVKVFQSFMLYRLLPVEDNPITWKQSHHETYTTSLKQFPPL